MSTSQFEINQLKTKDNDISDISFGLPLGCMTCVLPVGYAGAEFKLTSLGRVCNFCVDHKEPQFLGGDQLIKDISLGRNEQVGVTVSGGKDSLYAWMWLVDRLGPNKVVAFNHQKMGLVHPLAEQNLHEAEKVLKSELVQVSDEEMLPRFKKNFEAFLNRPDAAMVRVALCAGCRVGISGKMFKAGEQKGITKYISAASYLELAPFKAATMITKGGGDEHQGLIVGITENPLYDHGNNIGVFMLEDEHCHKSQLAGGGSYKLYPNIRFFDFDQYEPNIPNRNESEVKLKLNWQRPERSWHFDCLIESFKDLFYYGLLGYTETDFHLSAKIRYGLLSRPDAINQVMISRYKIINSREQIFDSMNQLGINNLIPQVERFYLTSPFLTPVVE